MKKSVWLPLVMLAYLALMAWIGRDEFLAGHYLYYFGIIGATLVCIVLLHFFLKKQEKLRNERITDINSNSNSNSNYTPEKSE